MQSVESDYKPYIYIFISLPFKITVSVADILDQCLILTMSAASTATHKTGDSLHVFVPVYPLFFIHMFVKRDGNIFNVCLRYTKNKVLLLLLLSYSNDKIWINSIEKLVQKQLVTVQFTRNAENYT